MSTSESHLPLLLVSFSNYSRIKYKQALFEAVVGWGGKFRMIAIIIILWGPEMGTDARYHGSTMRSACRVAVGNTTAADNEEKVHIC